MTTAEPVTRAATAKELAAQAVEDVAQLRTELTELRDQVREGGGGTAEPGMAAKLAEFDREFGEFVDAVNTRFAQSPAGSVVVDVEPIKQALKELEEKTSASFSAYSKIVDGYNTAATSAITELQEKVRLFDEAGLAPASAEDADALDARLKHVEALYSETRRMLAHPSDQPSVDHVLAEMDQRLTEMRQDLNNAVIGTDTRGLARAIAAEHDTKTPKIYAQVHELMRIVDGLGKDKTADKKMGGYAFRSIDAAMDSVGRALREVGVMFQPREIVEKRVERYETVSKDGFRQHWTHVWVTQRYAFVSLIDGSEMAAVEMDGEARDNGDKSTSKADSMRYKYALLQALCIPVNGLPESDGSDGTEGGQVYGRGSAGDAFDNASPVRPEEQHVDSRQHTAPEEVEASETVASSGGQQAAPQDDRTPSEKATAAYHALIALAGLEKAAQRPNLNRILRKIESDGIGEIVIQKQDGSQVKLGQYAAAVNAQVGA